jgi:hypothetical protein
MSTTEAQVADSNGRERTEVQIAPIYGERSEVRELVERLRAGYPDAKKIPARGFVALATMALAHGLDPWNGEVWIIYDENKDDTSIHVGIKGLRKAARKQLPEREHYYTRFKPILRSEYKELGLPDNTELAERCYITRTDVAGRYMELLEKMIALTGNVSEAFERLGPIPTYEGIGVVLRSDKSRMPRPQLVKKRAEADALKRAFDLPFDPPPNGDDDVIEGEAWEPNNGGRPMLELVKPPTPVEPVEEKPVEPVEEKPAEPEQETKTEEPSEKEPEKKSDKPRAKPKAEQKPDKAAPPEGSFGARLEQLKKRTPGSWKRAADLLNKEFGTQYDEESLLAGMKGHYSFLTDKQLEAVQVHWPKAVALAEFDAEMAERADKLERMAKAEEQGNLL